MEFARRYGRVDTIITEGYSRVTVQSCATALRAFFRFGIGNGRSNAEKEGMPGLWRTCSNRIGVKVNSFCLPWHIGFVSVAMQMSNPVHRVNFNDRVADADYKRPPATTRPEGYEMDPRRVFATVIGAILAFSMSFTIVLGQTAPTVEGSLTDSGGDAQPAFSETMVDQSPNTQCCDLSFGQSTRSRWTASADFITLDRVGSLLTRSCRSCRTTKIRTEHRHRSAQRHRPSPRFFQRTTIKLDSPRR